MLDQVATHEGLSTLLVVEPAEEGSKRETPLRYAACLLRTVLLEMIIEVRASVSGRRRIELIPLPAAAKDIFFGHTYALQGSARPIATCG